MMDELIYMIQAGRSDLLPMLWELIAPYVKRQAKKRYHLARTGGNIDRHGNEASDYEQAGYIAMLEAVRSYDPEKGSFFSWLQFYLAIQFDEAAGRRSSRQAEDPLHNARRLEEPIDEDLLLQDIIPDDNNQEEEIDEKIFLQGLRKRLEDLIDQLPAEQAEEIRSSFFRGQSAALRSEETGLPIQEIRRKRAGAMEALRSKYYTTRAGKRLEQYIDNQTDYTLHVGLETFRSTKSSSVEVLAMRREAIRQRARGDNGAGLL